MQISMSGLAQWLYQHTSFTTDQSREFVQELSEEQQQIVIAALESAYEAGLGDGADHASRAA